MDYIVLLGEEQEKAHSEKVDVLSKTSFLSHCNRREVQLLSYFMEQKEYYRRSIIALQGLPSNYMYIVYSGECAVVQHAMAETPGILKELCQVPEDALASTKLRTASNGDDAEVKLRGRFASDLSLQENEVNEAEPATVTADLSTRFNLTHASDIEVVLLGPGQYFGDREMLKGVPYENSLVAMSECKILRIHRDDCFSQMDSKSLGVLNTMAAEKQKYFVQRMLYLTDPERNIDFISKQLARPKTPPDRTTLVESEIAAEFRLELQRHRAEKETLAKSPFTSLSDSNQPRLLFRPRSPLASPTTTKMVPKSHHRSHRGVYVFSNNFF
jgi:CRP-like cAMP-binding protein